MAVAAHSTDRALTGDRIGSDVRDVHDPDRADAPVGPAEAGPTGPADHPRWVKPVGIGLRVLLVAALIGVLHFGIGAVGGFLTQQDRGAAVTAARATAVALTSFDGENADADVHRLLDTTTTDYVAGFDPEKESFIRQLRENKVKMTGTVTEAGLLDYDAEKDTASVLLAVRSTQALPDPGKPEQEVDYRIILRMEKVDGDWLTARTEFVQ